MADYAERVHGLTIIRDSLPNLTSVNDSTYQVVFSLHVLEHAPTYIDAADWCNEMLRVVEPGGFVVVVAPNVIEWKSYFWDTDWSHGYPTTPKRVSQIFDDLQAQLLCEKTMHFGSLRILPAVFAQMINFILPARFVDFITEPLLKRRIGTGFKLAFTLGLTFVVVRKPDVIV